MIIEINQKKKIEIKLEKFYNKQTIIKKVS